MAYDVDSDSDEPFGHEDKRVHPNDRLEPLDGSGKKGPRKSKGEDGQPKLTKETKAARRKEQNRAAQKAFRERREAKVKDVSVRFYPARCCHSLTDSWKTTLPIWKPKVKAKTPRMKTFAICCERCRMRMFASSNRHSPSTCR